MKTFQELLDSGWGGRHLDPMSGGCPSCGAGELVIVEDAEHELRMQRVLERRWQPPAPRRSRAVPGMFATSALLRSIPARRAAMGNMEPLAGRVRVG
jgi:hypothetical protein